MGGGEQCGFCLPMDTAAQLLQVLHSSSTLLFIATYVGQPCCYQVTSIDLSTAAVSFRLLFLPGVKSMEGKGGKKQPQQPSKGPAGPSADSKQRKRTSAAAAGPKRTKKQRLMCLLIPLAIIAILGGIGAAIGITMSQQRGAAQAKAVPAPKAAPAKAPAPAEGQPLAFKVNIALPPGENGQPPPSCSELFNPSGDRGKLEVRAAPAAPAAAWLVFLCHQAYVGKA